MARNLIETIMGAVVLIVAGGFLMFAYEQSAVKTVDGYEVNASFEDVSGIGMGSEVRIGGMKVGVVEALSLDEKTFQATAHFSIRDEIQLPKDTSAAVVSSGLLGDKFIKLEPGGDENNLKEGDTIKFTQSSISFEELIGKFVFSGGGVDNHKADSLPAEDDGAEKSENPFSLGF